MVNTIIASLALFGASVSALGSAHVVNKCSYDVYSCIVPASGGGYEQKDLTLAPGESWDQEWTALSNGAGWSIKFSHDEGSFGSNILQYEYTYQNDGNIWYDLSCVDGNPWDGNWEITSDTDTCTPRQAAYRFATDDAYGMQHCDKDASITVTLCSGEDNSTGSAASSAPAYQAPAAVSSAPAYQAPAAAATTLNTVTTPTAANNVATVIETVIVYQTAAVIQGDDGIPHVYPKRHQHHPHGHSNSE